MPDHQWYQREGGRDVEPDAVEAAHRPQQTAGGAETGDQRGDRERGEQQRRPAAAAGTA